MEPWSVVNTTRCPRAAASLSTDSAVERSNHDRVSCLSADSSLATSISMGDSERPWVIRSTKLKTMATTDPRVFSAERSRPRTCASSRSVNTFS